MGLEEIYIPAIMAMAMEVGSEGAAIIATDAAIGAAAAAATEGAVAVAAEVGTEAAMEAGTAAVAESVAEAVPEVAAEVTAQLVPEVAAEVAPPLAEGAAPLTEIGAAESWPLASGEILTPVETADQVLQQSVALEGSALNLAQAEASAAEVWGSETPWGTLLSTLTKAIPGADKLFESMANGQLNIPAMFQVLTAVLKLLGPLGPGIARFLQLHNVTAQKHIPAMLGTLQMMLGKMTQNPTTKDSGIIFNLADIQSALNVMGVRFSPEEELSDSVLVSPMGNVLDEALAGLSSAVSTAIAQLAAQNKATAAEQMQSIEAIAKANGAATQQQIEATAELTKASSQTLAEVLQQLLSGLSEIITKGLIPGEQLLKDLLGPIVVPLVRLLAGTIKDSVRMVGKPIEDAIAPFFGDALDEYKRDMFQQGILTIDDIRGLSETTFAKAMNFGITAHAFSALVELFHPTHHLGVGQLSAGLVDAAAFGPIVSNTIGTELRQTLGRLSMWDANMRGRTNKPAVPMAEMAYTRGFISDFDFRERLRYDGWNEQDIDAYIDVGFRRPAPRDLALIWEDEEADEEWITDALRKGGYHPDDIAAMVSGLRARGQKTAKGSLIGEAVSLYTAGAMDEAGLASVMEEIHVKTETQEIILRRARLARAYTIVKDLKAHYKTLATDQIITLDDYKLALTTIGLTDDVAAAEVSMVEAKVTGAVAKAEAAETKAEVRKEQSLLAAQLSKQVRLGAVSPLEMEAALNAAGISETISHSMAALAGLNALPVPKLPTVLSAEAAQQKQDEISAQTILTYVKKGNLDGISATAALVAMGMDSTTATDRVLLAMAEGYKAPSVAKAPVEDATVKQARTIRTTAAVTLYRGGEIDTNELRVELTAAGNVPDVVNAIVSRELARAMVKQDEALAKLSAQIEKEAMASATAGA